MREQFHYNTSLDVLSYQFYRIHPAVYGWLGEGCVPEATSQSISYQKLHYVFVNYPIDCICKSSNAYIAKENLIDKLMLMRATGIGFDQVQLSLSDDSECLSLTDFVMPRFRWLRIYGLAGRDDFGLAAEAHNSLVVSHRVRRAMLESGLEDSGCIPYSPTYQGQAAQTIFAT